MNLPLICLVLFAVGTWRGTDASRFVCNDCKIKYRRVGCYADIGGNRGLGDYILSERDKHASVYNGNDIDWQNFESYLPAFACRCAEKARKAGNKYFGLQYWGECWSASPGFDDYAKHGSSTGCYNTAYGACSSADKHCVGDILNNFVYEIYEECPYKFERVGCYHDTQQPPYRPLNNYMLTDRDPTSHASTGQVIDWAYYDTYMPEFACRCAMKTAEAGYDLFGLQYYGECWSDPKALEKYFTNGTSTACIDQCYRPCRRADKYCMGKGFANFVYRIVDNKCSGLNTQQLGCFNEQAGNRALNILLIDDKDPDSNKFSGHYYDDESVYDWEEYISELSCRCAIIAHEKGYPIYGIYNGGECWASKSSSGYDAHGAASDCFKLSGEDQVPCGSGASCAGNSTSIYVHQLN